MKLTSLPTILTGIALLMGGCSATPPIQKVSDSNSQFDDAVFKGETIEIAQDTSGIDQYRVFAQGATGFVPQSATRSNAENRANKFCEQKDKKAKILQERRSTGAQILGNFPRSELTFVCVDSTKIQNFEDAKYTKLEHLKSLLDSGVLTQSEYESEKAKVLSEK